MSELIQFLTYEGVADDPDLNKFTSTDLKDIAKAGIGTGGREAVSWLELIVTIIIVTVVISLVAVMLRKSKELNV